MKDCCHEHSGHESRLDNLEDGQKDNAHAAGSAHRRIDGMKNWVIAGMASMVMQLGLTVVYVLLKSKPGG